MRRRPEEHWRRIRTRLGRFWKKINKGISYPKQSYGSDISDRLREKKERQMKILASEGLTLKEMRGMLDRPKYGTPYKLSHPSPEEAMELLTSTGTGYIGPSEKQQVLQASRQMDDPALYRQIRKQYGNSPMLTHEIISKFKGKSYSSADIERLSFELERETSPLKRELLKEEIRKAKENHKEFEGLMGP